MYFVFCALSVYFEEEGMYFKADKHIYLFHEWCCAGKLTYIHPFRMWQIHHHQCNMPFINLI